MSDKDWVKVAMNNDSVVVELLMRLHHSTPAKTENSPPMPLEWSVRQRRSKPMIQPTKKNKSTPTASPTTPLSWSGATSVSGGGGCAAIIDGFEESSRSPTKRPEASRSKLNAAAGTATNKRSRKKKTLAELKDEEILLLEEKRQLERELATVRVSLEKQRATSERLKRLTIDMESRQAAERVTAIASFKEIPYQRQQKLASCAPSDIRINDPNDTQQLLSPNGSPRKQQEVVNQKGNFLLPDLNLPIESSHSEVIDKR